MDRIASDYPRSLRTPRTPVNLGDAYSDSRGVRFQLEQGEETFECLVLSSALRALDVYGVLHEGMLGVYHKNRARIEERAQRLVNMGLRGSRLVLYAHHFIDC